MHLCIYSSVYIPIVALRSHKRTWDVLDLDVQTVLSYLMCVLGARLWSSEQLNFWCILPAPKDADLWDILPAPKEAFGEGCGTLETDRFNKNRWMHGPWQWCWLLVPAKLFLLLILQDIENCTKCSTTTGWTTLATGPSLSWWADVPGSNELK